MRDIEIAVSRKNMFVLLTAFILGIYLIVGGVIFFFDDKQYVIGSGLFILGCFLLTKYFFFSKDFSLSYFYNSLKNNIDIVYILHAAINAIRDGESSIRIPLLLIPRMHMYILESAKIGLKDEKNKRDFFEEKLFNHAQDYLKKAWGRWQKLKEINLESILLNELKEELNRIQNEQREFLTNNHSMHFSIPEEKKVSLILTPEGKIIQRNSPL